MDTQKKQLLEMKRRELAFTKYFKKFESITFLDFEKQESVWYQKFFIEFHKFNHIDSVPNMVKPCGLADKEMIAWAYENLTAFHEETEFLLPVYDCLANVVVKSFSKEIYELWRPDANIGVNVIMAKKKKKKIFHIFEEEYEYQIYFGVL